MMKVFERKFFVYPWKQYDANKIYKQSNCWANRSQIGFESMIYNNNGTSAQQMEELFEKNSDPILGFGYKI